MMKRKFANVVVMAALGLLIPLQADAFGLGKLELSSALNEPFKAEIAITALQADDADNLQVRLASAKEFEQAGIERSFLLTQLKFDVVEKQGRVKIVISSEQPIREPFIDFLLTATTTSSGRLIREYTVLLDPPKNIFQKAAPTPRASQKTTNVLSETTIIPTNKASTNYQPSTFSGNSYGPVSRTDTLWDIALKTRPEENVTVHQMMMALLKANPEAFHNNNVNGLKAGYTLTIPSKNDIYKLSRQQAVNAFKEQNDLWKNRNARPKVAVETTEEPAQAAVAPKATETLAPTDLAAVTTKTTQAVNDVEETARLKLVVPKEQAALDDEALSPLGAEKIKTLSEQLSLAQETIEGQTQENIDFKSRMDALEIQVETMRRLISLKDADLARLQSMVDKDQQADENTLVTDNVDADNSDETIRDSTLETSDTSAENNLESLLVKAQKFVANNQTEVALGAGSLVLLLALLLIGRRRKENDDAEEWNAPKHPENNEGNLAPTKDKLEKAITVTEVPQVIETIEIERETVVELIEQADKLIAFGDYAKAMTMLEQLKQQEPTNPLILHKLLYVMFKQRLKEPFISLASSLNIDKNSAEWLEIATWGRELAPLSTLFHSETIASEPEIVLNMDTDTFGTVKSDDLDLAANIDLNKELDTAEDSLTLSNTIEFNLDDYVKDEVVTSATAPTTTYDELDNDDVLSLDASFDLDDRINFDTPLDYDVESNENILLRDDDEPISLSLTDEVQSETLSIDDALENSQDLSIDLNLEPEDSNFDFDISAYDEIDEAETKLDLASAYIDMGDPDGARNILEEVLKEGNDEQKARADALLKELS